MQTTKKIYFTVPDDKNMVLFVEAVMYSNLFENREDQSKIDICIEAMTKALAEWIETDEGRAQKSLLDETNEELTFKHVNILFSFYYNKFPMLRKTFKECGFQRFRIQSVKELDNWTSHQSILPQSEQEAPSREPEPAQEKKGPPQESEESTDVDGLSDLLGS